MHHNFKAFLLFLSVQLIRAELSDILKGCNDVSCDIDDEFSDVNPFNPDANYKFMTAGATQIFWDAVISGYLFKMSVVKKACKQQLEIICNSLQHDEEWAYHFLDASGKTPAAVLKSSRTSMGDYDQCLGINSHGIQGKYCMIDMHHLRKNTTADQLALHRVHVFRNYPFFSSLCLPSACEAQEVQQVLRKIMKPYAVKAAGDIHCDTETDISYRKRLENLTGKQIVSMVFVLTILAVVFFCTAHQIYNRMAPAEFPRMPQDELSRSLSIIESMHKLFHAKAWKFEILVFDALKWTVMFFGTSAHILTCAESPLSYATIDKHSVLNDLFERPAGQPLMNDTGLLGMPFLTGVATFMILYPLAKSRKLPYAFVFLDRFIRFLPSMLVLTALEFLWPLAGSGPFYTRVAEFNLKKCEKNWYFNLLFMNNYFIHSVDICGGHSFYSSVDMQLFLLGLVGVYIFSKNDTAGIIFSGLMVLFGTFKIAYNAIVYQTSSALFVVNPVSAGIAHYFNYIHMKTPAYIPAYFTGFIIAYYMQKGTIVPQLTATKDHVMYILIMSAFVNGVVVNLSLSNTFNLYPSHLNWLSITINRSLQLAGFTMVFLYYLSWKSYWIKHWSPQALGEGSAVAPSPDEERFSFFKAICRLCFPLYISNYLYIRTEFFTRRFVQSGNAFWMFKRMISSLFLLYLFAIVFHVIFLAPFDAVREYLFKGRKKPAKHSD